MVPLKGDKGDCNKFTGYIVKVSYLQEREREREKKLLQLQQVISKVLRPPVAGNEGNERGDETETLFF